MVLPNTALKVTDEHLKKLAVIYVRQSTRNGVRNNVVGGRRQREEVEALALEIGWSKDNIRIVDYDQAVSGSSTDKRYGYLEMLTAISEGKVGAVFSLESARLGRDSADWHFLIKACDLNQTLIIDPEGIYDASDGNDSTLMKVKALMSEMELRWIRNRLLGAKRELAKKGQLRFFPPTGYVWGRDGKLVFEPDESIQESMRMLFLKFEEIGTALGTVKYFARHNLKFPCRIRGGPRAGEHIWQPLSSARALSILKNPAYAGAYVYGRSKTRKKLVQMAEGMPQVKKYFVRIPPEDWEFAIQDSHPGYIPWSRYLENQHRLKTNCNSRIGAPRAGTALLQGLILCGKCGKRMSVRYTHSRFGSYICESEYRHFGGKRCQAIPGAALEEFVTELFLQAVSPVKIKMSLNVLTKAQGQSHQDNPQWDVRLKRASTALARAKERLLFVDYTNRPAFDCAQEDLSKTEQELERLKRDFAESQKNTIQPLTDNEMTALQSLARDLPKVWASSTTDSVLKKRLLRCLIEDITVIRNRRTVRLAILWKTSARTEKEIELPAAVSSLKTSPEVIQLIREMAESHTSEEIAKVLNEAGLRNKRGGLFTKERIKRLRERYCIKLKVSAEMPNGCFGASAVARMLAIRPVTVYRWCKQGVLNATRERSRSKWWIRLSPEEILRFKSRARRNAKYQLSYELKEALADYQSNRQAGGTGAPIRRAV